MNISTVVQVFCVPRCSCGMMDGTSRLFQQEVGGGEGEGELNTAGGLYPDPPLHPKIITFYLTCM